MLYDLILADNSKVSTSMTGVGLQGDLWIHAHGLTLVECVNIFSDPNKTSEMHVNYDRTISDMFVGFTELFSVSVCGDFVRIGLGKGVGNA